MEGSTSADHTTQNAQNTQHTQNTQNAQDAQDAQGGAARKALKVKKAAPKQPKARPKARPFRRVAGADLASRIVEMQRKLDLLKSKSNLLEDRLTLHKEEQDLRIAESTGTSANDTGEQN
jgi:hypothetical protein